VYAHLAAIHRRQGRPDQAAELQALSGLPEADSRLTFTVASATDPTTGLPIGPRRITEVVPGTVYALSGFDFAELYFVVSRDRRQLIAIDAGTRPDTVKAAYEALRARVPGLPAPTTVLITHAHFDHIGGRSFFERLAPRPTFYARQNYAVELAVQADGPPNPALRRPPAPAGPPPTPPAPFRPDVLIDRRTDLAIGGTRIELVPIRGGETVDAMLVHLPDLGVMFVGDFAMVLLGSPYRDEGNLDGLFEAIDEVARRNPKILLHGHAALTQTFGAASLLVRLEAPLAWLRDQTVAGIRRGAERGQLQQANLIAPGVLQDPELQLPYLLFRESVINRIYDQRVGPWQPDLAGVDVLTQADRGALLVDYLGVTEPRLVAAVQKLTADGRYELAATALEWAAPRYPRSAALQDAQRFVYQKLTEKYQSVNIFKFMLYAAKAGEVLGPVGAAR
jgi:glyoxylase-like metal-dependent hydrolase (beta-lactamase superfamily II)